MTSTIVAELSERAGIDARYAREWLEQQAVAGLLDVEGGYDAAFIFEALHDMARPVEALAAIRALLAGDEVERLSFGFSWWHCLPASRAETPSVAAGTGLRSTTVRKWSSQAGFASLEVLPVDHLFWRFYRLTG